MDKQIAGDAVQNNLVLIIVPLFALLALAIMFVVIPIFAGMVGSGSASAGLVSMSDTLASFSPIYGIAIILKYYCAERIGNWDSCDVLRIGGLVCRSLKRHYKPRKLAIFPFF